MVGRMWKVWLVAADCCLIGMQPILTHLTKQSKKTYSFHPISVTLMVDVTRTIFSLIMLFVYGRGVGMTTSKGSKQRFWAFKRFLINVYANKALIVPAALYALNGYLKFIMLLFFSPTTAKMLGNLKVLVIAVLMKLVLQRRFSLLQWEALVLLCVGISFNQLDHCIGQGTAVPFSAIACTAATLLVPSLASIFNEWAMKKHMDTSVHVQSFFLCFFGLCINLVSISVVSVVTGRGLPSLFNGHSKFTGLLVVNNALQGILASFFYKYADTILKKYSSTLATVFTAVMSAIIFGDRLSINFFLAVITVFCSMHIFFSQGGLKASMSKTASGSRNLNGQDFGNDSLQSKQRAMEEGSLHPLIDQHSRF